MALAIATALATTLVALTACGSDSDGGGNGSGLDLNRRTMTVQVDLPAGVTAAAVQTMLGEAPVAGGAAQVPAFDGRQLTVAVAASGEPLLFGFLGGSETTLDAERFAEALLYFATGATLLPPEEGAHEAALAAIGDAPGLSDVAEAIEAALLANPDGFLETGSYDDVVEELEEAVAALRAQAPDGRGVLVQPLESKSGLRVNTTEGVNSIFLTNRYRRLGHAFIDRVSTFDDDGNQTPAPKRVTDFSVPSVQKLGSTTSTLVDIVYGKNAFEETSTGPVALEAVEDAAKTRYRLVVVGPGQSDGEYNQLTQEQADKQLEVTQTFVIKDLFLPMVLNLLIPGSKLDDYLKFTGGGSLVKDLIKLFTSNAPKIWEKSAEGDIEGALFEAWNTVSQSSTFRSILLQRLLDAILDSAGPDVADKAFANGKKLLNALKVVDTLLAGIDGTAAGLGVGLSNRADVWQIDVTAPKVRLDPETATLDFGEGKQLTANTPDIDDDVPLVYKYTVAPTHLGQLRNARGSGAEINSSENFIFFDAGETEGTVVVKVEVFQVDNQNRISIGSATSTLTIEEGCHFDEEDLQRVTVQRYVGVGTDDFDNAAAFAYWYFIWDLVPETTVYDITFRAGPAGDLFGNSTLHKDGATLRLRPVQPLGQYARRYSTGATLARRAFDDFAEALNLRDDQGIYILTDHWQLLDDNQSQLEHFNERVAEIHAKQVGTMAELMPVCE